MMRILRRSPETGVPVFYRNIPKVDLLPSTRRPSSFGAPVAGQRLLIRAGLTTFILVTLFLFQLYLREDRSNQAEIAQAEAVLGRAETLLDNINELREELALLKQQSGLPALDWAFLSEGPSNIVDAMITVHSTQVPGVTVRFTETVEAGQPNVGLEVPATDLAAVLLWRARVERSDAVARVTDLRPGDEVDGLVAYDAVLVLRPEEGR